MLRLWLLTFIFFPIVSNGFSLSAGPGNGTSPDAESIALKWAEKILTTADRATLFEKEVSEEITAYIVLFSLMKEEGWQERLLKNYRTEEAIPHVLAEAGREGRLNLLRFHAIRATKRLDKANEFYNIFLHFLTRDVPDSKQKVDAIFDLIYSPNLILSGVNKEDPRLVVANHIGPRLQNLISIRLSPVERRLFWTTAEKKLGSEVPVGYFQQRYPGMDISYHPRAGSTTFPIDRGPLRFVKWWQSVDNQEYVLRYMAGKVRSGLFNSVDFEPFYAVYNRHLPDWYKEDAPAALEFSERVAAEIIPFSNNSARDFQWTFGMHPQLASHPALAPIWKAMLERMFEVNKPVDSMVHYYLSTDREKFDAQTFSVIAGLAVAAMEKNGIKDHSHSSKDGFESLAAYEKEQEEFLLSDPKIPTRKNSIGEASGVGRKLVSDGCTSLIGNLFKGTSALLAS